MSKPSGLGRGLGSLIPGRKTTDYKSVIVDDSSPISNLLNNEERVAQLPVENIVASRHQPREMFNAQALEDLASSIRENGIIQPLIVCKRDNGGYELVAGERRLRAAKIVGLKTVPAIVRDLSEQKQMELALIENLQREDLNALEVAVAYRKLEDEFNLSRKELAHKVGKSESAVTNTLRLLNLRDEVQEAIRDGRLTAGHARSLAGLSHDDQLEGMDRILSKRMNVREAELATQQLVAKKNIRPTRFDPEAKDMENRIAERLGTKVEVKRHGGKGQIIIRYFSNEELKDIVDKILK
jgi:ParB family transcriptional regulator, chromosome partitioning protein